MANEGQGAFVEFRTGSQPSVRVGAGGLLGRAQTAEFVVDHPQISEAHALVSLRDGSLWLLSLRGRLSVRGEAVTECVLEPGLEIELAPEVVIEVARVNLPTHFLGVLNGVPFALGDGDFSLVEKMTEGLHESDVVTVFGSAGVVRGHRAGACLRLVLGTDEIRVRSAEGVLSSPLPSPGCWRVGELSLRVTLMTLPGVARTGSPAGSQRSHLIVIVRDDTVIFERDGARVGYLAGLTAQIICELAEFAEGPVHWKLVAAELWRGQPDLNALRANWDKALARLRRKLGQAGFRPDLVRTDGHGNVELCLATDEKLQIEPQLGGK